MPAGVNVTFGGDASDANRALQSFERALVSMQKQAESGARALTAIEAKLSDIGKNTEPPQKVSFFADALNGVSTQLTALVGGGALLSLFTKGMSEAAQATQDAAANVKELERSLQLAARVAGAGRESRATIEQRGREIAISEGLSPADAISISALASQEGFGPQAATFARAQARLGVSGAQAIDVAGKLRESFGEFSAEQFFGSVIASANQLGASPEEVIGNLETVGPQAARAGFDLDTTIALITGLGEKTGKKQAIGAARALFDRLAGGIETERPADAADINAALSLGKTAPRTVKDKVRFTGGLAGVDQLLARPELAGLLADDTNLALALETLPGVRGALPGLVGQRSAFPEAALPTLRDVRGQTAERVLSGAELGTLGAQLEEAKKQLQELRARVLESQGNGILGSFRQARFSAESAAIDLLRAPFGASSQLSGIRSESADLVRLLERIEANTRRSSEDRRGPELASPGGPGNFNGRPAERDSE